MTIEADARERHAKLVRDLRATTLVRHVYTDRDPDGHYTEAVLAPDERGVRGPVLSIVRRHGGTIVDVSRQGAPAHVIILIR